MNNVTRSVLSLVDILLLNATKTKISEDVMCVYKEKLSVDHIYLTGSS